MAMIKCPNCGKEISDKANACPACGEKIEVTIKSDDMLTDNTNSTSETALDNTDSMSSETIGDKIFEEKTKKKKGPIIGIIVAIVIIASCVGGYLYYAKVIKPANEYKEAENLLSEKKYADAQQRFKSLGDYKDSSEKIIECDYASASDALEAGNYDLAKSEFNRISDYKDASDKAKECDYQKALDFYNDGDYDNAIDLFSTIFDYSDSKHYVYDVYAKLAGQDYVDEYADGIDYLNSYIQTQSKDLMTYVYSSYWGTSTEDSWSPDLNDKDLKSMEQCMTNLNTMKSEFKSVFSKEVIENCNDETLNTACEQFEDVHDSAEDMLSSSKAMKYISDIVNGSTDTMEKDTTSATNAMSDYTKTVNSMKEN